MNRRNLRTTTRRGAGSGDGRWVLPLDGPEVTVVSAIDTRRRTACPNESDTPAEQEPSVTKETGHWDLGAVAGFRMWPSSGQTGGSLAVSRLPGTERQTGCGWSATGPRTLVALWIAPDLAGLADKHLDRRFRPDTREDADQCGAAFDHDSRVKSLFKTAAERRCAAVRRISGRPARGQARCIPSVPEKRRGRFWQRPSRESLGPGPASRSPGPGHR
jgi:hypothetical protein